jgi:hypothetical protein
MQSVVSPRFLSFEVETMGLIGEGLVLPELLCAAALIVESDGTACTLYEPKTWPDISCPPNDLPARVMNQAEVLALVEDIRSLCA